jgi:site-specific DNA-methyltransferase (adenine-specific)
MDDTVTIGAAALMLGDCVQRMRELPDGSVDLVLTDPPFSSGATQEAGRTGFGKTMTRGSKGGGRWFGSDCLSTRAFLFLMRECAVQWQRVLKPGGHLLTFIDWRMEAHLADGVEAAAEWQAAAAMADAVESADLRRVGVVVWDKGQLGMGRYFRHSYELINHFTKGKGADPLRRTVPNVLRAAPVRRGQHPTEKPVDLLATVIETLCPVDRVVLDSFAGSFSTGSAALITGRRFVGIERDRAFFTLGCARMAGGSLRKQALS